MLVSIGAATYQSLEMRPRRLCWNSTAPRISVKKITPPGEKQLLCCAQMGLDLTTKEFSAPNCSCHKTQSCHRKDGVVKYVVRGCVVKGQRFCYPPCSQCSSETNAVWQFVLRRGTALLIIKLQTKSQEHRQYQRGQSCKMNILARLKIKSLLSCVWWSGGAQTLIHCSDSVW